MYGAAQEVATKAVPMMAKRRSIMLSVPLCC